MLPFRNPNTGFYRVGNQTFLRKTEALLEATRTNTDPKWVFHNDVFDKVQWQSKPIEPLKELYRRRAQQLRDKYDWLVLNFSGGMDSWGVLNAFISNGIHLDEVFVRWPKKGLEGKYTPNTVDKSAYNLHSEWDFAIKPELDKLAQYHPEIKITIHDWTYELDQDFDEDSFGKTSHYLNLGAFKKFGATAETEVTLRDKEKRVGVIYGVDKPQLVAIGDDLFVFFLDSLVAGCQPDGEYERNIELFYWSPDMPDIVRCQAHMLFEFFKAREDLRHLISFSAPRSADRKILFDLIRDVCQPEYDKTKFQAGKPTSQLFTENDHWLRSSYGTERFMQAWRYSLVQYYKLINKKYFYYKNGQIDGYNTYISDFYKIGSFSASGSAPIDLAGNLNLPEIRG